MKKLMPESKEYWVNKGFTDDESLVKSKQYKGYRYAGHPNYYLLRNKTDDYETAVQLAESWKQLNAPTKENQIKNRFGGDENAYKEWNKNKCSLSKKYLVDKLGEEEYIKLKRGLGEKLNGKRPNDLDFWIDRGFSIVESKQKVKENARKVSKRCVEYWIFRGFNLEDSIEQVSKYQNNTSIDKFIERYGWDDGILKYESWKYGQKIKSIRSYLFWMQKGYSEEEAISKVSEIQASYSELQPKKIQYWINKGFQIDEAKIKSYKFARLLSVWCEEYWIDKGLTIIEAKKIISEIQKENSIKGLQSFSRTSLIPKSKVELLVVEFLSKKGLDLITDSFYDDYENRRIYFPDIIIKDKCIIEIYGDFWHGNLNIFNEDQLIFKGLTVKEKQQRDYIRIENLKKCSNLPVFIWWESEIYKQGLEKLYLELIYEIG